MSAEDLGAWRAVRSMLLTKTGSLRKRLTKQEGFPAPSSSKNADIKDMSFERALKELETIVGRLERGDVELEESIVIYERGEALKEQCDRLLKQAEAKVEKLTFNVDGSPSGAEPFDPQN